MSKLNDAIHAWQDMVDYEEAHGRKLFDPERRIELTAIEWGLQDGDLKKFTEAALEYVK